MEKKLQNQINQYAKIVHKDGLTSEAAMEFVTKSMDDQQLFKYCRMVNNLKSKKYQWPEEYTSCPIYDLQDNFLGLEDQLEPYEPKPVSQEVKEDNPA